MAGYRSTFSYERAEASCRALKLGLSDFSLAELFPIDMRLLIQTKNTKYQSVFTMIWRWKSVALSDQLSQEQRTLLLLPVNITSYFQ